MNIKPRYLLDTNICIYLMKHQPPQVVERFRSCKVGEVTVSAITAAELEYGVMASEADQERNSAALAAFFWRCRWHRSTETRPVFLEP